MTWNILADGLSIDGFVVPVTGVSVTEIPKYESESWDSCMDKENSDAIYECLTSAPPQKEVAPGSLGSLAEFIADQEKVKEYVITRMKRDMKKDMKAFPTECGDEWKKVGLSAVGLCAQDIVHVFQTSDYSKSRKPLNVPEFKISCQYSQDPLCTGHLTFESQSSKVEVSEVCKDAIKKDVSPKCQAALPEREKLRAVIRASVEKNVPRFVNVLELLNRKWNLLSFRTSLQELLSWGSNARADEARDDDGVAQKGPVKPGRGKALVEKIRNMDPDILALQELDHYRFMQDNLRPEYITTKAKHAEARYTMEIGCGHQKWDKFSETEKDNCMREPTFARVTKFGSNAQKMHHTKPPKDSAEWNDNDGVAIFWKQTRFNASRIDKMYFDKKEAKGGGVVGVLLHDLKAPGGKHYVWAFTTHIDSGNSEKDEAARKTRMTGPKTDTTRGFAEWLKELTDDVRSTIGSDAHLGIVLMMDGNSYQGFAQGKVTVKDNMYHDLVNQTGLENFELPLGEADSEEKLDIDDRSDLPEKIAISVNKIRGVDTAQLHKLGEYQLDRIDYMLVNPTVLEKPIIPLDVVSRSQEKRLSADSPYNYILPNADNPSDHLPLVATISWASREGC
eukprot:TRINITY_DN26690_c0_g1_i1.p1 TRINITY_DN26690_c0_g1~~TRINITY_DN26690_c0_g1_i1.p1  ORF type:complete len:671 (-),score=80.09 TRINITY_DN26690_c0_g1_i1:227-2083(-)